MGNGSARDNATKPLPRRGADSTGRIPTKYGPGNPISDRLKRHQFRVRPGAPNLPIPEPQQAGTPSDEPLTTYAVRPGTPADSDHQLFEAMAEKKTDEDRRRRLLWLGVAVVALIGLVGASAALLTSHPVKTAAGPVPTAAVTTAPAPSPPPAEPTGTAPAPSAAGPDPVALVSTAGTDTAPLSTVTLFPGKSVTVNGHSYTQALTAASGCAAGATPQLAAVLAKNGCQQLFRATYGSGTTAVTVGVAVFDSAARATAAKQQAQGNLQPLAGGALPAFCHLVACRLSANSFGRYAYFTVAGYTTGKPVPTTDTSALAAGTDIAVMAFQNLVTRARNEAATAAP
ncbi:hypothetical protein ACEZCY_11585 [Streptacidiphilus sp. N1-12]|uniref:Uncharacterized protein n=2 Tax=Streptacidiphilus alkalitolerans TaxID=3342712 RepID=A0ABV6WDP4_9ACTN